MLFLRPPEFGNKFSFVPNVIQHRNGNGELRVYQGNRPKWESFSVSFTAMTRAQIDTFKTQIMAAAGNVITITDHENRNWIGIVSSRRVSIRGGRGECNYQVSFDFEGNLI